MVRQISEGCKPTKNDDDKTALCQSQALIKKKKKKDQVGRPGNNSSWRSILPIKVVALFTSPL